MIRIRLLKRRKRKVKTDPKLGGQWKEKEKVLFHLFPLSPQATLLRPSFFSFDIKVLLYQGSRPLFTHSFLFPWPINFDRIFLMSQIPHTFIIDSIWLNIFSFFLEIMASHMAMSYGPQAVQMNKESTLKSSLDLTLP